MGRHYTLPHKRQTKSNDCYNEHKTIVSLHLLLHYLNAADKSIALRCVSRPKTQLDNCQLY